MSEIADVSGCGLRCRSLAVSLVTTGLDVLLFALCALTLAGRGLLVARWICGAVGALANFLLNRAWAFRATSARSGWQSFARYGATALVAVTLATAVWWALLTLLGWDARLLHLLSLAIVWIGFTFPMLRRWVFAQPRTLCP